MKGIELLAKAIRTCLSDDHTSLPPHNARFVASEERRAAGAAMKLPTSLGERLYWRFRSERPMTPQSKGVLLALVLFTVLSILSLDNDLRVEHDSGIYITLAEALATGQGYREIFFADHPTHTLYPPVFPLLLVPLFALFGYHFLAMKLLVVALGLVALYLLYVFYRGLAGDLVALLVVLFTATSYGILFHSQSVLTELPYLCFSLLALFWVQKESSHAAWPGQAVALAVVLIPLAYLTRIIGLSLLLATVMYLVCDSAGKPQARLKRALVIGSLAAVPALAWFLRNWWIGANAGTAYSADWALGEHYASQSVIEGTITLFVTRIRINLPQYVLHSAQIIFFHTPWVSKTVLPTLLAGMIFGGFLWCALRRRTIVEYYVGFYMLVLLLYRGNHLQRYLVPLIPFIWYYFLTAGDRLLPRLGKTHLSEPRQQRGIVWAATLLLAVLLIANGTVAVLANTVYKGRDDYYHVVGEDMYKEVALWAKAHTPSDSVFMWAKPSLRFLWAERKAAKYPHTTNTNTEDILRTIRLQNVAYVVVDAFSAVTQRYLRPVVEQYPDDFSLVYEKEGSKVYRVLQPHANSTLPSGT